MHPRAKSLAIAAAIALASFAANCTVFVFSYNHLTTLFLTEEQRVANAGFILTTTAGAFGFVALLMGLVVYRLLRRDLPRK